MITKLKLSMLLMFGIVAMSIAAPTPKTSAVDVFVKTCTNADFQGKVKNNAACKDANSQKGSDQNPIIAIISSAIKVISYVIGAAAIIGILIGSIRLINSAGDVSAISDARRAIYFSVIGLVVALMAQMLVTFVLSKI